MNELEANALLTAAGLIDARAKTQVDRAIAWANVLDDVDLDEAQAALREHQRRSTDPVLPAHILAIVKRQRQEAWEAERHASVVRELSDGSDRAVPMPPELREAFRMDAEQSRLRERALFESGPVPMVAMSDAERAARLELARRELDEARERYAAASAPAETPSDLSV